MRPVPPGMPCHPAHASLTPRARARRPLEPFEEEALREWEWHFKMKYERLGALIVDDGSAGGGADGGAVDEAAPAPSDAAPREAELVDGWRTVRA